jgi:D-alanyl-lipoteichoic acid acyltransferase DltB (MBOAT superfamily)
MAFIPAYILILAVTIVVDYFAGLLIEKTDDPRRRKFFLVVSLIANVGFLSFFKYFNFLNGNLAELAGFLHWNYSIQSLEIILPIGLSFHTFQAMSYTIEVFRHRQKAERHFGIYALYVLFYPQLVAGPIERPQNMLHQFREERSFDYERVVNGLKLMTWGFYKKVVIADRLALLVNPAYGNPIGLSGPELALATLYFATQIYCDFSGYSDIAIGAAQVMGFKLMQNFKRPYYARSITEFWRRWHISLSTWFRDYLYIPLGGNRVSNWRRQLNVLIVFIISGLWHGANWTFVIWGLLHGVYQLIELNIRPYWDNFVSKYQSCLGRFSIAFIERVVVLCAVCFAWIFFRAQTLSDAFYISTRLFFGWFDISSYLALKNSLVGYSAVATFVCILIMEIVHYYQEKGSLTRLLASKPLYYRWALYIGVLAFIAIFGEIYSSPQGFIYFQF